MTLKEQLFQALDNAPDYILEQMLSDIRRLQVKPADPTGAIQSLRERCKIVRSTRGQISG
jgi:hypothetical protein